VYGWRHGAALLLLPDPHKDYKNLLTDQFHFHTQILIQFKEKGLRIREIPVPTHYGPESQQMGFGTGLRYGLGILISLLEYRLHKSRFVRLRSHMFGK